MKPREFWITVNDEGLPSHIALFEKLEDRKQIHVREVLDEVHGTQLTTYYVPSERLAEIEKKWTHSKIDYTDSRWLIDRLKKLTEVLEDYRGIAGHSCANSTTKWSTADQVLEDDK